MAGLGQRLVLAAPRHGEPYGRYTCALFIQGVSTPHLTTYLRTQINQLKYVNEVTTGDIIDNNSKVIYIQKSMS